MTNGTYTSSVQISGGVASKLGLSGGAQTIKVTGSKTAPAGSIKIRSKGGRKVYKEGKEIVVPTKAEPEPRKSEFRKTETSAIKTEYLPTSSAVPEVFKTGMTMVQPAPTIDAQEEERPKYKDLIRGGVFKTVEAQEMEAEAVTTEPKTSFIDSLKTLFKKPEPKEIREDISQKFIVPERAQIYGVPITKDISDTGALGISYEVIIPKGTAGVEPAFTKEFIDVSTLGAGAVLIPAGTELDLKGEKITYEEQKRPISEKYGALQSFVTEKLRLRKIMPEPEKEQYVQKSILEKAEKSGVESLTPLEKYEYYSGSLMFGAEKGTRDYYAETPVTALVTFGATAGIGAGASAYAPAISKVATKLPTIAKVGVPKLIGAGITAYTGYEVYKAPTIEAKGEIIGKRFSQVTTGLAGAKTGAYLYEQFTRPVVSAELRSGEFTAERFGEDLQYVRGAEESKIAIKIGRGGRQGEFTGDVLGESFGKVGGKQVIGSKGYYVGEYAGKPYELDVVLEGQFAPSKAGIGYGAFKGQYELTKIPSAEISIKDFDKVFSTQFIPTKAGAKALTVAYSLPDEYAGIGLEKDVPLAKLFYTSAKGEPTLSYTVLKTKSAIEPYFIKYDIGSISTDPKTFLELGKVGTFGKTIISTSEISPLAITPAKTITALPSVSTDVPIELGATALQQTPITALSLSGAEESIRGLVLAERGTTLISQLPTITSTGALSSTILSAPTTTTKKIEFSLQTPTTILEQDLSEDVRKTFLPSTRIGGRTSQKDKTLITQTTAQAEAIETATAEDVVADTMVEMEFPTTVTPPLIPITPVMITPSYSPFLLPPPLLPDMSGGIGDEFKLKTPRRMPSKQYAPSLLGQLAPAIAYEKIPRKLTGLEVRPRIDYGLKEMLPKPAKQKVYKVKALKKKKRRIVPQKRPDIFKGLQEPELKLNFGKMSGL